MSQTPCCKTRLKLVPETIEKVPETPIQTHRDNSSNNYIEMERAAMDIISSLDEYPALCELKSLGVS